MSSVVRPRRFVQWSLSGFLVLTLGILIGCQPVKSDKESAPKGRKHRHPRRKSPVPQRLSLPRRRTHCPRLMLR